MLSPARYSVSATLHTHCRSCNQWHVDRGITVNMAHRMCTLTQAVALLTVKALPQVRLGNGVNSYVFPDTLDPQHPTGSIQ